MKSAKSKEWQLLFSIFLFCSGLGLSIVVPHLTSAAAAEGLAGIQTKKAKVQTDLGGFGILGDSNSDEYQADDHRGSEFAKTTLSWVEQLVAKRELNFGPWGAWDEPRRTGYKYNWARSGATTRDMILSGQPEGLAQQVASGEVSHVFIWIGMNDFNTWNGTYQAIYEGDLNEVELQAKVDGIVADITTAVDTLLQAGEVQIVIATIADRGLTPSDQMTFPDPAKRQRITEAINQVNAGIIALAKARNVEVADVSRMAAEYLSRLDKEGNIGVGGIPINFAGKGNDPHFIQLDDEVGHPGTVASGLIANHLFIDPFNRRYGMDIQPLSDQEILESAGISSQAKQTDCFSFLSILMPLLGILTLSNFRTK
jgi:phospholipase/lecithinase/hemolysin